MVATNKPEPTMKFFKTEAEMDAFAASVEEMKREPMTAGVKLGKFIGYFLTGGIIALGSFGAFTAAVWVSITLLHRLGAMP